jgi:light-harvesting complex 1 alpha chain
MWRYWRIVDPRKAIIATGLLIAVISASIHLIFISTDRYNPNTWHPSGKMAAGGAQNSAMPASK